LRPDSVSHPLSHVCSWFNTAAGFVLLRLTNNTVATDTATNIRLQSLFIDDYSDCVTGTCTRRRSLALPTATAGSTRACTLSSQVVQGRLSLSGNGEAVTLYCFATTAGATVNGTFEQTGTVALVRYTGEVDTTRVVPRDLAGCAGCGLNAANLPTAAGSDNGADVLLTAEKASGALGWQYFAAPGATPVSLRNNDGYAIKYRGGYAPGSDPAVYVLWGTTALKAFNSTFYKSAAIPDAVFNPNLFVATGLGMSDFDVDGTGTTIWAVGSFGLYKVVKDVGAGTWAAAATYADAGALVSVALSRDGTTVYATSRTAVFSFDVASSSWNNGGAAVVTAAGTEGFRGIAAVPSFSPSSSPTRTTSPTASVTASRTPSGTASPSTTATNSFGTTGTGTCTPSSTATPSNTITSTGTPTATGTMTTRGGPLPATGFVVVTVGAGNMSLPNLINDITVPVALHVYTECGAGCTGAPTLLRTVSPWTALIPPTDQWGNRFFTANSGSIQCSTSGTSCRSTYRMGKLVPSGTQGSVIVAGFDAWSGA
jgi:hypothetical protein